MPCTFVGLRITFFSTDMCGNKLKDWNTIPIFWRTSFGFTEPEMIDSPSRRISPESMATSRLRHFKSVDLPEPEDPIRQTTSCGSTAKLTSDRTTFES